MPSNARQKKNCYRITGHTKTRYCIAWSSFKIFADIAQTQYVALHFYSFSAKCNKRNCGARIIRIAFILSDTF